MKNNKAISANRIFCAGIVGLALILLEMACSSNELNLSFGERICSTLEENLVRLGLVSVHIKSNGNIINENRLLENIIEFSFRLVSPVGYEREDKENFLRDAEPMYSAYLEKRESEIRSSEGERNILENPIYEEDIGPVKSSASYENAEAEQSENGINQNDKAVDSDAAYFDKKDNSEKSAGSGNAEESRTNVESGSIYKNSEEDVEIFEDIMSKR